MQPPPEQWSSTSHKHYSIAWITILAPEFDAARSSLDHEHARPQIPGDPYRYIAGSMCGHNVVLARTIDSGTNAASNCAAQLMRSFPIVFGLLVGIGGGVPSGVPGKGPDIRLADVVVNRAGEGYGGVVSYDEGKVTDDGFVPTGHVNRSPLHLQQVVGAMESDFGRGSTHFGRFLVHLEEEGFRAPKRVDQLYDFEDPDKVVKRPIRHPRGPHIHYGLIASGSHLMKTSGKGRADILARIRGRVLCFEMEAAGVMNTFPCLVVRGISDYCDSNKNDDWRKYASATAASYCKWLLKEIEPASLRTADLAADVVGTLQGSSPDVIARRLAKRNYDVAEEPFDDRIRRLLLSLRPGTNQKSLLRNANEYWSHMTEEGFSVYESIVKRIFDLMPPTNGSSIDIVGFAGYLASLAPDQSLLVNIWRRFDQGPDVRLSRSFVIAVLYMLHMEYFDTRFGERLNLRQDGTGPFTYARLRSFQAFNTWIPCSVPEGCRIMRNFASNSMGLSRNITDDAVSSCVLEKWRRSMLASETSAGNGNGKFWTEISESDEETARTHRKDGYQRWLATAAYSI